MTEEIIINEKSLQAVLKRYDELEQENKELQAYKDINEDFKQAWYELNEKYKQLRSALEEIREICKEDKEVCLGECGDFNTASRVLDRINEVLK